MKWSGGWRDLAFIQPPGPTRRRCELARVTVEDLSLEVPGRLLLSGATFSVDAGECVAVVGPSGVGKTSLLNCVAGIDSPAAGAVRIDDMDLARLPADERGAFRLRHIGLVFQFGELLPELTLVENVALPLRLVGISRREAEARAMSWLDRFELSSRSDARPEVLSGGEIQRAGIARALVHRPSVVLADEPTGMLDEENTERVVGLLVDTTRELGSALLLVTHDSLVASAGDRVMRMGHGRLDDMSDPDRSAEAPVS